MKPCKACTPCNGARTRANAITWLAALASLAGFGALSCAGPSDHAAVAQAPAEPAVPVPPAHTSPVPAEPVMELLSRAEAAADGLHSFTAKLHYETVEALIEEKVIRQGDLIYSAADPAVEGAGKSLAIRFDVQIAGGRKRTDRRDYLFHDRWLIEIDPEQKLFIKREVAAPGERFDPFALGEGPFPLPVGQKRDVVLERFDVAIVELPEDGTLAKLRERGGAAGVMGVHLVPKPGGRSAKDVRHIDVFYETATYLPVGVSLVATNGDRKSARLDDLRRNEPLDAEQLTRLSAETPDPKAWHIDIRPLDTGAAP